MRYDVISQYGDRSILLVSVTRLADPQDSGNIVLVSLLTNQEQGLPFRELYWQIRNKAYFPICVLTNEEQGFPFRELCWLIRNKAYFQISVLTNQEQGLPFRELYWPIRTRLTIQRIVLTNQGQVLPFRRGTSWRRACSSSVWTRGCGSRGPGGHGSCRSVVFNKK